MKKLIIIPAYNESANIEKTIKMIQENAPEFDYVIINDCSKDNTRKICEENHYNIINLPINLGIPLSYSSQTASFSTTISGSSQNEISLFLRRLNSFR